MCLHIHIIFRGSYVCVLACCCYVFVLCVCVVVCLLRLIMCAGVTRVVCTQSVSSVIPECPLCVSEGSYGLEEAND